MRLRAGILAVLLLPTWACSRGDDGSKETGETTSESASGKRKDRAGEERKGKRKQGRSEEELAAAEESSRVLWSEFSTAYKEWPSASPAAKKTKRPHGPHARLFFNPVVDAARNGDGDYPDGSVLVFAQYGKGDGGEPRAFSVMKKIKGEWFWARYQGDGKTARTRPGTRNPNQVIAGTRGVACVRCHKKNAKRDMVHADLTK